MAALLLCASLAIAADGEVKSHQKISDTEGGFGFNGTLDDEDRFGSSVTALGDLDGDGTVSLSVDGSFTYTPNAGFDGTDSFNYKANDGTVDSDEATVTITVEPCTFALDPSSVQVASDPQSLTVQLDTQPNCTWTATSDVSWISLTGASSGTGSATIPYSVQQNESSLERTGTLTVAEASLSVTQSGASVEFEISPAQASFPFTGGTGTVEITGTPDAGWTTRSTVGWIDFLSPDGGSGDGSVQYTVQENRSADERSAVVFVAGRELTVRQAGQVTTALAPWGLVIPDGGTSRPGGGLDDIGVFGIEDEGRSRGPWLQVFDADGDRLTSAFLSQGLEDGSLTPVAMHEVLTGKFDNFTWLGSDLDVDGSEEVLLGYSRANGRQAHFLVVEPVSGEVITRRRALGGGVREGQLVDRGAPRRGPAPDPAGSAAARHGSRLPGALRSGWSAGDALHGDGCRHRGADDALTGRQPAAAGGVGVPGGLG